MKKIILTAVCGLLAAGASAKENLNFSDAEFSRQLVSVTSARDVQVPEAKPGKARTGSYVQVSGYVSLTGNGFVPGTTGGYTSVTLSGWATFRDSSGKVSSNNAYISVPASMWIYPNQYVFETVWPNVYAQFYRDGKFVGSANMSGNIQVSGFPSSSFVYLNGSGYLNGSLYVEDAQP